MQNAVDAIAYAQLFLKRFNVNVRSALLQSAGDHRVDQSDDRSFTCRVTQMLHSFLVFLKIFDFTNLLAHLTALGRAISIIRIERFKDVTLAGKAADDRNSGCLLNRLDDA